MTSNEIAHIIIITILVLSFSLLNGIAQKANEFFEWNLNKYLITVLIIILVLGLYIISFLITKAVI